MKKLVSVIAVLLCSITQVHAQDDGFYIGASYIGAETQWLGESEYDAGFEARIGYGLNDLLSFEASYIEMGTVTLPNFVDAGGSADTESYTLSAIGALPIGNLSLFGKIGYLWSETDGVFGTIAGPMTSNVEENEVFVGAGVSFHVFDTFELRLEVNESDEFSWAGLGLNLRF